MIPFHSVDQFPLLDVATYLSIFQGIPQRDSKTQNGSFSRPGSQVIPVDTSIPPLRLPPQPSLSSRFFAPSAQSSNIIAVDSSPERPAPAYVPHQSHFTQNPYGTSGYSQLRGGVYQDSFATSTLVRNPQKSRPEAHDGREPPRKKQNTGRPTPGIILVDDTPESSPVGRGWTASSRAVLTSPLVDDESPGPNRIRRGRPGEGMHPPESPSAHRTHTVKQPALSVTSFMAAFPQASEDEIKRAIFVSQGDYTSAAGILQAIVHSKEQQSHSISIAAQQEQQRKEKEMARQRKNKSAIYAHRNAPPAQVAPPPVKRNNDDSDSDGDDFRGDGFDSDASDAEDRTKDRELEIICTTEAIEYFNTADTESLVMMIGR